MANAYVKSPFVIIVRIIILLIIIKLNQTQNTKPTGLSFVLLYFQTFTNQTRIFEIQIEPNLNTLLRLEI